MSKIFEALQYAQAHPIQPKRIAQRLPGEGKKIPKTLAQTPLPLPGNTEPQGGQEDVQLKIKRISAMLDLIPPALHASPKPLLTIEENQNPAE